MDPAVKLEAVTFSSCTGTCVPRCQHVLRPDDPKTRAPDGPRQCRKAAEVGREFCRQHDPHVVRAAIAKAEVA